MAIPPVPYRAPMLDQNGNLTQVWASWFQQVIAFSVTATSGLIVNADVSPVAAIAYSKLALTGSITNADLAGSIADSKLSTLSTAGKVSNSATTATSANTASAIVARDASGNFSAGTITAALTGNVTGNCSGSSGSTTGNAATVTTNANLTGPITSVGNATSVASQTGTGTKFVMDTSPTLVTPVIGAATGTSLSVSGQLTSTVATGTAPLVVSSTTRVSNLNAATAGNADTVTTNANLTGDVTSVGNAATIPNNTVTNAKMADMATATFKGRTTAGTGDPEDLTATQATALLNAVVGDSGSGGTKGLVPAPAAGDAAAAKFLKADGTWGTPAGAGTVTSVALTMPSGFSISGSPVTGAGTLAVSGEAYLAITAVKTTTYAIATTDHVVQVSGASAAWTATLPTAVGVTGKVYRIIRTDQTFANQVTIATTSAQTIRGATTFKMSTQYEELTVVSDGANWQVISHSYPSAMTDQTSAITLGSEWGTTSNKTIFGQRRGKDFLCRGFFTAGTTTASNASIALPSGLTIDTAALSATNLTMRLGEAHRLAGSTEQGFHMIYDTGTTGSVFVARDSVCSGSKFAKIATSTYIASGDGVGFEFEVPISGWEG